MSLVGFEKPSKIPSFRIFSRDDLDAIHWVSLDILEKTGIRIVEGEEVLEMLKNKGCSVDFKKETVLFHMNFHGVTIFEDKRAPDFLGTKA